MPTTYTVNVDCSGRIYTATCLALGIATGDTDPAALARKIRSAAATVMQRRDSLRVVAQNSAAQDVLDDLNIVPQAQAGAAPLAWCSTTGLFFRPLSLKETRHHDRVFGAWCYCPYCDTHMRLRDHADYDALHPQPHPLTFQVVL